MDITFNKDGLIPVITQDFYTKEVLILSYMNREAYQRTLKENILYYYSRSRQSIWRKGETSGNTQELMKLAYDCDQDALLAVVKQKGVACHTGNMSCFHNFLINKDEKVNIVEELYGLIEARKTAPVEGSYTNYLLAEGREKILKKIGEEASEIIIASMAEKKEELIYELSDFVYHALVLMVNDQITLSDVLNELYKRFK